MVSLHLVMENTITNPSFVFPGGNSLDKAPVGRVHDFVKVNGGHTVITKVRVMRMAYHYFGHPDHDVGSHRQ